MLWYFASVLSISSTFACLDTVICLVMGKHGMRQQCADLSLSCWCLLFAGHIRVCMESARQPLLGGHGHRPGGCAQLPELGGGSDIGSGQLLFLFVAATFWYASCVALCSF